ACSGTACRTNCTSPSDCLADYFCNSTSTCQQKKDDGVPCSLLIECASGHCVGPSGSSICCSSECDPGTIPGATCVKPGHVGQCECQMDCGDAGSCRLFYRDFDGDSYGDPMTTQV